jgi:YD repeat-containing protein
LISDLDAAGGELSLDFFPSPTATGTSLVQVTGRPTGVNSQSPRPMDAYEWQLLPGGDVRRKVQSASGLALEATGTLGGSYDAKIRDAAAVLLGQLDVTAAPDPRFGPYAGYARTTTVTSGGITQTIEVDRAVALADPDDVTSATALEETITAAGRTWQSHFDVGSRTFTLTSPEGRVSTVVLDAKERVTSITLPGREPLAITYDPVHPDRVATIQMGTTTPRMRSLAYDAAGRLDFAALPNDPLHGFGFDFDDAWRSTTITDPLGGALSLGRDDDGNVTTVTMPDQEAHGLSYTPVDLLEAYTPPVVPDVQAPQTHYFYNLNRTVDYSQRPGGYVVDYMYDNKGRIESVLFDAGTLSYTYDDAGRTETATRATLNGASTLTLTFTYNGLFPETIVLSGAPFGPPGATYTVDQGYDARWLLQSENVAGKAVTYAYDDDSLVTAAGPLTAARNPQSGFIETTAIGTVGTSHAIDPGLGAPTVDAISAGGTPLMTIEYVEYDAAGRLTEKVEAVAGEAPVTYEYVYDHWGWLTDEYRNGTLVAHVEYDANGNRTAVAVDAGAPVRIGVYDDQDRLTQLGDVTYAYTLHGELYQRTGPEGATTTYTYDDLGVLVSVVRPDGTEVRYIADPLGRRIAKLVNGQVERGWLYGDSLLPLAEVSPAGEVTARFVYLTPGAPDLIVYYDASGGETRYRVFKDHLGSPRMLVNAVDAQTG